MEEEPQVGTSMASALFQRCATLIVINSPKSIGARHTPAQLGASGNSLAPAFSLAEQSRRTPKVPNHSTLSLPDGACTLYSIFIQNGGLSNHDVAVPGMLCMKVTVGTKELKKGKLASPKSRWHKAPRLLSLCISAAGTPQRKDQAGTLVSRICWRPASTLDTVPGMNSSLSLMA
jgi:hypothetical protein